MLRVNDRHVLRIQLLFFALPLTSLASLIYTELPINKIYVLLLIVSIIGIKMHWSMVTRPAPLVIIIPLCTVFLVVIFNILMGLPIGLFAAISMLASCIIGYSISRKKNLSLVWPARLLLLGYYLFFIYKAATVGYTPLDINLYFPESSHNTVSAVAIFLQIGYSASFYRTFLKLPKITPWFTFILCFMSFGRSGVAISLAIALLSWLEGLSGVRKTPGKIVFMFAIFYVAILVVMQLGAIQDLVSNSKFGKAGFDTPRYELISEYVSDMNFHEVLVGRQYSYQKTPNIVLHDGNPHNSFIRGHHLLGLPYLIWLAITVLILIWHGIINYQRPWLECLGFLFLLRAFFDILTLPGFFGVIFFYTFFTIIIPMTRERS